MGPANRPDSVPPAHMHAAYRHVYRHVYRHAYRHDPICKSIVRLRCVLLKPRTASTGCIFFGGFPCKEILMSVQGHERTGLDVELMSLCACRMAVLLGAGENLAVTREPAGPLSWCRRSPVQHRLCFCVPHPRHFPSLVH